MWNESDVIANEMYNLDIGISEPEEIIPGDSNFVMERSATPELQRDGFILTWRIENFTSFGRKTGEYIESPTFLVERLDKTEWYLRLYPRGDVDDNYIACYLYRRKEDKGPENIVIGYKISFITVDGTPNLSGQVDKLPFAKNKGFGNTKFKKRDELFQNMNAFLPRDTLTVRCHMWKCFFEKSMVKECFASTRLEVEKCFLTWTIKNFSACQAGEKHDVPFIPASTKVPPLNIKWYMTGEDEGIHIDVIHHGKKVLTTTYVNCKISLLDSKGSLLHLCQKDHIYEAFREGQVWQLPPLIEKSKILANKELYLPNDSLSLVCELSISLGEETSVIEESSFKPNPYQSAGDVNSSKNTLKKDLLSLYTRNKFCDVTLRTPRKSFQAHKVILAARSPVFYSILEEVIPEEDGITVTISDMAESTVNDMLIFMYSETLDHPSLESAIKLYCAAVKYQVASLKGVCSHLLKSGLTISNVCLVLALANEHRDNDLKSFIQEFICYNANEIFHSKQWKDFMERKPTLAGEMMHLALKKK